MFLDNNAKRRVKAEEDISGTFFADERLFYSWDTGRVLLLSPSTVPLKEYIFIRVICSLHLLLVELLAKDFQQFKEG